MLCNNIALYKRKYEIGDISLRMIGTFFLVTSLLSSAAYAGSDSEPQDSLDSVGQMFLEISKDTPVSLSHAEQMAACRTKEAEISAKMTGLKEFLALSDKQLSELSLKSNLNKEHSYIIALASFEIDLRRAQEKRDAARDAVSEYRKAVKASKSAVSAKVGAEVLADVEAALAAAEAALKGQ